MLTLVLSAIWLMLPAYIPNNVAVLVGGGLPIDMGRHFIDGRRILGDGKTFRGFFGGLAGGIAVGALEYIVEVSTGISLFSSLSYYHAIRVIVLLVFGSLAGDMAGSFIKRRIGRERGSPVPLLDQLDFVGGAFAFGFAFGSPYMGSLFTKEIVVTVLVITPILHILVNYIAYKIGRKNVPW
jgi:CDP-2,3-bis-(O-geranylgeranyl)-sn-glycerol synthase